MIFTRGQDRAYGLSRMFQAYADDGVTGWITNVTRTRKEAENWLFTSLDRNLTFGNFKHKETAIKANEG